MMLTVILKSVGNPDLGQDPQEEVSPYVEHEAETFRDVSVACQEYIWRHDLGVGNWADGAGGVYNEDGDKVARVSYNGRVWGLDGSLILEAQPPPPPPAHSRWKP
jgi:hypothetical protein